MTKNEILNRNTEGTHPFWIVVGTLFIGANIFTYWNSEVFTAFESSVSFGFVLKVCVFALLCWVNFAEDEEKYQQTVGWRVFFGSYFLGNCFIFIFFTNNFVDGMLWIVVIGTIALCHNTRSLTLMKKAWFKKGHSFVQRLSVIALPIVSCKIILGL